MIYKKYTFSLFVRVLLIFALLTALAFSIGYSGYYLAGAFLALSLLSFYNFYKFVSRRFVEMDDFFEAVKYRDFSRWFVEDRGPQDLRRLHKGFNQVNRTIRQMNASKEAQFVYLQKILEMVEVGIIAYNLKTGDILWANDSIKKTLDIPSFKNLQLIKSRKPELYTTIFEETHLTSNSINIEVNHEKMKVLVSDSVFHVEDEAFKIIVLQNIDETLNRNESEAWKKLLSVMTHEIMNSIAPISSLAETLQQQVMASMENPQEFPLEMEDVSEGISSIKKRSEGLMKFAKTYRSLNKITHLNLSLVPVKELFLNIDQLMQPSLAKRKIHLQFVAGEPDLQIEIDSYLIEQVLINLIVNAIDACEGKPGAKVLVKALRAIDGKVQIHVMDNGKGIPGEILESIFVPFFSTKKSGSGIGLSLCKQIMMLHKGKIQVNSIQDTGTTFSLIF